MARTDPASRREYETSPSRRSAERERQARLRQTPERQAYEQAYRQRPERRAADAARSRAAYAQVPEVFNLRRAKSAHGPNYVEMFAQFWADQGGCCYLCGTSMDRAEAVVDHDHNCCPAGKSCAYCRRGLACDRCNVLIGHAKDDADLLRLIAANLEAAAAVARARIASMPVQTEMQEDSDV